MPLLQITTDTSNMSSDKTAFEQLGPNQILDSLDAMGWRTDGRVSGLNSYENRVYLVGLEDGSSVVTKFYRPKRWSDAAIQEEHTFTRELLETDIPVICPQQRREISPVSDDSANDTLFHWQDFRFSVFPRAGGRPPELDNPEQLEVIGRAMARLHLVGEQQPFSHRHALSAERLGDESVAFLLGSDLLPIEARSVYEGVALDILKCVHEKMDGCNNVTQLRIHGDFHPGNILWGASGTPHLLDFDDACTGPAVQDLWMFISGDRQYATARLGDLLEGYTQFREFDPAELQLIEPLRALRLLHYAAWIARRWDDPAFGLAFPFFAERRFWDEHILGLREQRAILDEPPLVWD